MLQIKANPYISDPISEASTGVDNASLVTSGAVEDPLGWRDAWQKIIDNKLIEWAWDPSRFEDEGVDPPTRQTVSKAIQWAVALRDQRFEPPNSVVIDPNGGIVFELRGGADAEVLHIWDDGTAEYLRFHGTRLVERRAL